ncbi:MAG: hypothetical protein HFK05_01805 [Clostridia bacterium]|nr:hypothetical protein [Clostridia bacterium]
MLSRSENEIMRAVYDLCDGTDGCLVSPVDILCLLPPKRKYDIPKIDSVLHDLSYDGYFDIITSERKGEKMYVINLKESGMSYKRMIRQRQRDIAFRIALAFVGALATFLFGLIIRGLFG